jgi:hypothetical protein
VASGNISINSLLASSQSIFFRGLQEHHEFLVKECSLTNPIQERCNTFGAGKHNEILRGLSQDDRTRANTPEVSCQAVRTRERGQWNNNITQGSYLTFKFLDLQELAGVAVSPQMKPVRHTASGFKPP